MLVSELADQFAESSFPDQFAESPETAGSRTADRTAGSVVVIAITGEMDRDNCAEARVAVGEVLYRDTPDRIDLDLSQVTFLDSAGIRSLLLCRHDARSRGCELSITAVHPHVHQVLAITGLLDEFGLN
ncbi:STAS domain-containing protein [Actinoplanes couchii]|uniref:STAS domain-containing protein n=1 Tax=Actinoplanes couchii TaxID=403638 RepID=UPI00194357C0|nr:STAS domain-containing protein [Actinoplanes couchii]MDR6317182.1 anti-anti-sigma factor [Actinoplanes couchii]